jgi:hypothetical protein
MSVRVRDLEIALVLAREMKAAAARSVDASLRLDQLQEVFGVERLDRAERARIQTALQMAGLEPFPSLLEADPTEPIRFGASQGAVTAERAIPPEPNEAAPEPAPAEAPEPTFPTVGEFARSKLGGRSRRRFGLRRGDDHSDGDVPPPPPPPPQESNGRLAEDEADADATRAHEVLPEEPEWEDEVAEEPAHEPIHDEPIAEETAIHEVPEEEVADEEPADEEPAPEETAIHEVPEEDEPEVEDRHEEPELEEPELEEPELEEHPATAEDEREYIPLVPQQPVADEPEPPQPEPQRVGARGEEVLALLLPAVAIPVIVTSIAGWRFGLPFVALSVIATGWLLSRHGGVTQAWRRSPAAGTVLKTTAAVTVLSAVAAIVLAGVVGKDDSTKPDNTASPPAKKPAEPSTASKPATTTPAREPAKKKPRKKQPQATQPSEPSQPSQPSEPSSAQPPDPDTEGLIRVPPSQAAQTPTTPSSAPPGTSTQPTP